MILKRGLVTVSLALLFDVAAIGQQSRHFSEERFRQGLRTAQLMSNVIAGAQVSGSLEFNAKCGPDVLVPDLPPVREPRKPYAPNAANTLRSMFAVDGRLVISQESNGTIRVVEPGVQTDILHVRINHLSFKNISDPDQALNAVLGTLEVQSFIQIHGIGQPFDSSGGLLYSLPGLSTSPLPEVRGISGELNNVTLADALDYVLKTFPGFWLYQDCESLDGQRLVYFGLFPVPGRMWLGQDDALVK
jgi:hypothetical protein